MAPVTYRVIRCSYENIDYTAASKQLDGYADRQTASSSVDTQQYLVFLRENPCIFTLLDVQPSSLANAAADFIVFAERCRLLSEVDADRTFAGRKTKTVS